MSLIADSLKKAVKEKSSRWETRPDVNPVRPEDALKKKRIASVIRFFLLVVFPSALLIYLIAIGAFNLKREEVAEIPKPEKPLSVPEKRGVEQVEVPKSALEKTTDVLQPPIEKKGTIPAPIVAKKEEEVVPEPVTSVKPAKIRPTEGKLPVPPEPLSEKDLTPSRLTKKRILYPPSKDLFKSKKPVIPVKNSKEEFVSERKPSADRARLISKKMSEENLFQNSDYFFNRAIFFQQAKDWEKALHNYNQAEKLDPDNPDTYNNKGVIYKELEDYDTAMDELLRAVYLDPGYGKAYNNIGVVYYMMKKYDQAVRNYEKAIDIDPNNLEAFNNLAIIYKKQKETEKARAILNRALSIDSNHAGTNYNLAILYEENREMEPALYYYRKFLDLGKEKYPSLVFEVKKHLETLKSAKVQTEAREGPSEFPFN